MNKKKIFGLALLALIGASFIAVPACVRNAFVKTNELNDKLEREWNFVLPDSARVVYDIHNRGWMGDGVELFAVENGIQDELPIEFSDVPDDGFEEEVDMRISMFNADDPVDEQYLPDWERDYCWKLLNDERDNTMYLWHYSEDTLLHILINY